MSDVKAGIARLKFIAGRLTLMSLDFMFPEKVFPSVSIFIEVLALESFMSFSLSKISKVNKLALIDGFILSNLPFNNSFTVKIPFLTS